MATVAKRLHSAHWTAPDQGVVTLARDWVGRQPPPLYWAASGEPLGELEPLAQDDWAALGGYQMDGSHVTFVFDPERFPQVDLEPGLFVAGPFNGWGDAIGKRAWKLEPADMGDGRTLCRLTRLRREVLPGGGASVPFKFVTGAGNWIEVPADAPNCIIHDGFRNWEIQPGWSGRHRFTFRAPCPAMEAGNDARILWRDPHHEESVSIAVGSFLTSLATELPLGVHIEGGQTVWRVFAPRAQSVAIRLRRTPDSPERLITTERVEPAVWEGRVGGDLHGWCYDLRVDGDSRELNTQFDPDHRILDPYALVTVSPTGPALVWDHTRLPCATPFTPPPSEDLVIAEVHIRDVIADPALPLGTEERRGFAGFTRWIRDGGSHLRALGVNAIELQPVHENDARSPGEYHWGYMTTNFFSPASQYARDPRAGSQIEEFHALVQACHEAGLAVILDVVYNHVGEPPHLMFLDRQYYFELDPQGALMNWSGCGNTLRANSPMARHLILASLRHYVETFGVDGFRFDLAELLGLEVLAEIERELRTLKPGIILIAEPWSFRGNIIEGLRETGYAAWNDGFREFAADYVRERGTADGLRYFLGGSIGHHARVPVQSINYVESHDDWAWIDRITENADGNGFWPTARDRRRTHLMAAILFGSLGVPMISAGQDFLRSKQGHRNTYLRGDLNALDYTRAAQYSGTFEYFRNWIALRRSPVGRAWRMAEAPPDGYLRWVESPDRSAAGMVFNAAGLHACPRLFLAVNPHLEAAHLPMGELADLDLDSWKLIADTERVDPRGLVDARPPSSGNALVLPPLSCALFAEL